MKSSLITAILLATSALGAAAEQPRAPMLLPEAHTRSLEAAGEMADHLYANVRLASPFRFAAPVADEDEDLVCELTDYAARYLGTRYRLGASGPKAFDCSGFTSYVFRQFGIELTRSSRTQWTEGEKVENGHLRPGDLVFFSSRGSGRGRVGHVGIVVDVNEDGSWRFIHASTTRGVVYQNFPDGGYYERNYIGAKRVL